MILRIGSKHGLVWGAALIAYGVIYGLADIPPASGLKWLFYLLLAAGCVLAIRSLAGTAPGAFYRARLATGSFAASVGAGVYAFYVFLYNRFIDDSLIRTIVSEGRSSIEAGGVSPEQAARSAAFLDWMANPAVFAMLIFVQLLVTGVLASLVAAIFFRNSGQLESPSG